ncbi:MAG: phosphate acetyltransferase [Saccharospirillum sp.]
MPQHTYFLTATVTGTGLTSVCLGLVRALQQLGVKVAFCKPIAQRYSEDTGPERSTHLINATLGLQPAEPMGLAWAQQQLAENQTDALMEEVIQLCQQSAQDAEVVVVEGLVPNADESYIGKLNVNMARALDADIILVAAQNNDSIGQLNERIQMSASLYGGVHNPRLLGCIINKVGAPDPDTQQMLTEESRQGSFSDPSRHQALLEKLPVVDDARFRCLGTIGWDPALMAPRMSDICAHLQASPLFEGELTKRRIHSITICARTMKNMLHTLKAGALVVTPGDRDDILLASSLAAMNGVPLAGLVFTGNLKPEPDVLKLCHAAFETGLPVLTTRFNTYRAAQLLDSLDKEVPVDDIERMEGVMNSVAASLDAEWLAQRAQVTLERLLSPPAFRHLLVTRARQAHKRIVLPEGDEVRTIQAAAFCQHKGIAQCLLLGNPEQIRSIAERHNISLPEGLEIQDPEQIRQRYVAPMVALREHKGLTAPMAEAQLEDTVVLATMMLAEGEVDGLVSGAVHTTANTIRPALQLIKTKADASLVSSVFFMLLPDQAVVYGDCAVNPGPDAEQLADIAIQSGDSARAFGIEPRIAMISYSTGESGSGSDVEKVRQATHLAQSRRPDLMIDGPLQYDAASVPAVAASKAPNSPVAGRATVFIFPDLNTGNTTYKAVQRSASVVSIGPMLQGLRKPVNDLSRGATVDDIIYTIALTAIQAHETVRD